MEKEYCKLSVLQTGTLSYIHV